MWSPCQLVICVSQKMAASGVHQRKLSPKKENDGSEHVREGDSEPGVLQGLLPCIVGVAGISLLIWLLFFIYVPPSIIKGNSLCTRLSNPESLTQELGAITDWQSFAVELGVSSEEIENVDSTKGDKVDKIGQILRLWSEKAGVPCLEKLINTLKKLDETTLADTLAAKHQPT